MKRKNNGKKVFAVFMALVLFVTAQSISANAAGIGYQFAYKGVSVTMGDKAKKFIKKAGRPVSKKAKKSCAYDGKDRTYKYKGFILYTYSHSDNGAEYVNGITFLNQSVRTKEGIKIGSSLDEVLRAYGKGSEKFGIYTYEKGKCKLQIEITDDKVTNLRYIMKTSK